MAVGSFAHDALADLDPEALARMLELEETLFVEHKSSIGKETAHGLVKTVASFANTAGGWLLIGVHDGEPAGIDDPWAHEEREAPTLVDVVRDRLRGEIDPLPSFEAKVDHSHGKPVGVVRVYESADTPHVALSSGAVYVREVAGVTDAAHAGKPEPGKKGERRYEATQIRSRQQLVELAERGRRAAERVDQLLDPTRPLPLVSEGLLKFEPAARGQVQPSHAECAAIVIRIAPFTLAPRFLGWATTADAAAAVLSATEDLARRRGLNQNWVEPDPSGASVRVPIDPGVRHCDAAREGLPATAKLVLDGAGVAGAALELPGPGDSSRRKPVRLEQLAHDLIRPVIEAAADVLVAGEFLGRSRCQIDLVRMRVAVLLEEADQDLGRFWVPTSGDLPLPPDPDQIAALAQRAANAYGRSAGIGAWDKP